MSDYEDEHEDEYDEYDEEDEYYEEPEDEEYHEDRDEIHKQKEQMKRKILEIHPFLPRRTVIIKSNTNTRNNGWKSETHEGKAGKTGQVIKVHENVLEAVKVKFGPDDNNPTFWHYKDLMLVEVEEEEIIPVHFNPMNLVV